METLQDLLVERESVWERLAACGKPVVLYGMGDGAQKILNVCAQKGIVVADIFASDEFVRGHSFAGYRVLKYAEICQKYDDFVVVLAFATQRQPLLEKLRGMAREHELVAPDVPVAEENTLFDSAYLALHRTELEQVYALLGDDASRRAYAALLNYKISGKISYLQAAESTVEDAYALLALGGQEDYVDLGAYRGDTVEEVLHHTGGAYHSITALEPDAKTFAKLEARMRELGLLRVRCCNLGAWSHAAELHFADDAGRSSALLRTGKGVVRVDAVDHVLDGAGVSYLKMDVEGAEREALEGCQQTILQYQPKLCVAVYHRNEDIFALPLQVHALNPAYRLYLRHFPYIPAWDTNLYAL